MFYQNNNDYMRDAFYYSQPQNNTYQYNGMNNYMPMNNGMYQNPFMNNCCNNNSLENMYPQIYRTIYPVTRRVLSNNQYQCYTEDNINNMVDTVYNIVEGDVSTLSNTQAISGDDTVSQGPTRNSNTNVNKSIQDTVKNEDTLLKDLIKIIIIKELLNKQNSYGFMNNVQPNYYDTRYTGMM